MNIQRRTFLGGLLAAVAASKVGQFAAPPLAPQHVPAAEKLINMAMPEPEEGYRLVISPGFGLPEIKVASVSPVLNQYEHPSLQLTLQRQGIFGGRFTGSLEPARIPMYEANSLTATVEGQDVHVMHEWMRRMIDDMHGYAGWFTQAKVAPRDDYRGHATFGPAGRATPLVEITGLFPKSLDSTVDTKITADVVFHFDYATQDVL